MPRDRGRPAWPGAKVLVVVVAIAAVVTLLGLYVYSQWQQPPAVMSQEPVLDEGPVTPRQ